MGNQTFLGVNADDKHQNIREFTDPHRFVDWTFCPMSIRRWRFCTRSAPGKPQIATARIGV
jgi:hypothetical protein